MATGYSLPERADTIGVSGAIARPETEMESLSATMGNTKRRLADMLDMIEERLERFAPTPKSISGEKNLVAPEPQPGSLASLHALANSTGAQLNRLDAICTRLGELI